MPRIRSLWEGWNASTDRGIGRKGAVGDDEIVWSFLKTTAQTAESDGKAASGTLMLWRLSSLVRSLTWGDGLAFLELKTMAYRSPERGMHTDLREEVGHSGRYRCLFNA